MKSISNADFRRTLAFKLGELRSQISNRLMNYQVSRNTRLPIESGGQRRLIDPFGQFGSGFYFHLNAI